LQPLPALGSAPETGLQFGATMLGVWEPAPRLATLPASLLLYALRSTKSQTRVGVEAEHWSRGNARRVSGTLGWQAFPLPFYGIGDRAPATAKELFTPTGLEGSVVVQQRAADHWYVTGGIRHLQQSMTLDSIGVLETGVIHGTAAGAITELSVGLLTDTRDNIFAPHRGRWVQASYARSVSGMWSDYQYGKLRVDARGYHAVRGTHVLAAHVQVVGVNGAAPFDQLALVGASDLLRGYERGRYRDRWTLATQGEYRTPMRHRLGAVAFAGAGIAAPRLSAWRDRTVLPTYGAGLRGQIDSQQRTSVRVDYGRGRDGASGVYIGFNQAF
jgi:hypothetical protein